MFIHRVLLSELLSVSFISESEFDEAKKMIGIAVAMFWALVYAFCATLALYLSAVTALEFIGVESSSVALAFPRCIAVAAVSVFGFVLSWLELLIYLAFFTVYTSGMFTAMAAATGIIWIVRTSAESVDRILGQTLKTKKIK